MFAALLLLALATAMLRYGCNEGVAQLNHAPPTHTVMVAHGPK